MSDMQDTESQEPAERDDQTMDMGFLDAPPPKPAAAPASGPAPAYQVLARKYRSQTLSELIGQDVLVRTLGHAITSGRMAHAYLLTGVRGVGKTSTARIIARGLNCVGADGKGGPTPDPCGVCGPCRDIAEGRHVDVIEMDAASNNGVGEMREIIEQVRYAPVAARYKVYILDEVHMLSTAAFNALLKTLEEPPPHTKFIFATTEVRKLPVTVLSRCQRFDLRRVDAATLAAHYISVAGKEGVNLEPGAARLIARAADGSVRDGMSLLDRAIASSEGGLVAEEPVRAMLGLADRFQLYDLFELLVKGEIEPVMALTQRLHDSGADPLTTIQDLLTICHLVTRARVAGGQETGDSEADRIATLGAQLPVPALTRVWQMLLKGLSEIAQAPDGRAAMEMLFIRLTHMSRLPDPADLIRRLTEGAAMPVAAPGSAPPAPPSNGPRAMQSIQGGGLGGGGSAAVAMQPAVAAQPQADGALPATFEAVVALCAEKREPALRAQLMSAVHLVKYEPGRIELRTTPQAPSDLAQKLAAKLLEWTGKRWFISLVATGGAPTIREQSKTASNTRLDNARAHPLIKEILSAFPGAVIDSVRALERGVEAVAGSDALIESDDENGADPDHLAEDLEDPDFL
jgi:DNA polymerase-3 subunit gamma/tau